jgi:hypothetical protein
LPIHADEEVTMKKSKPLFHIETRWGEPLVAGDTEIVPQSQAVTIRWPNGGYVWNRPIAVVVRRDDQEERLPIVDVTLVARLALFALGVLSSLIFLILSNRNR